MSKIDMVRLYKGINAEDYIIEQLNDEFGEENLTIHHQRTRGIDLNVKNHVFEVAIEVKSAERYIYWSPKNDPDKKYRKNGGFPIAKHQLDPDCIFAFVINEKNGYTHFYVNGENLVNYVMPRIKNDFYRLYLNKLKELQPKTNLKNILGVD